MTLVGNGTVENWTVRDFFELVRIEILEIYIKIGYSGGLDQYIPCAFEHRFVLKVIKNDISFR